MAAWLMAVPCAAAITAGAQGFVPTQPVELVVHSAPGVALAK